MAANKTAFEHYIGPNASGLGEGSAVHQTSPCWVLTFLQWSVRDTLRTEPTTNPDLNFTTMPKEPLVVENDCVQVSVADSKSVLTPSMTATLLITDINYETELAPGDFVFVNMLNWEQDARRVADRARAKQSINGINDGFKGFFKVQSVRKSLISEPQSGIKSYTVKITGFAFTEFNNSIYFNPYLLNSTDSNLQLYISQILKNWATIQTEKGLTRIQDIIRYLIGAFIGPGFPDNSRKTDAISPLTANTHFYMPQGVGNLLGITNPLPLSAKDAYNFIFGIQSYSANSNQSLAQGMNPSDIAPDATKKSRFMILPTPIEGNTVTKPEYWNQQQAWSILNQYTNAPLNEMYSCFRVSPNGSIMPTIVLRQIPFTTDDFDSGAYKVTRFMNLPRWNIDPALAFSFDLGRDEALRKNFIQFYGISVNTPGGIDISSETAKHNYVYDIDDVKRNGLKPHVISSEFDRLIDFKNGFSFRSPGWAKIMGDALIGGHLKMSGTINFVGIPEPIAVGDNLRFDQVIYHIEEISHNAMIDKSGKKMFRTTITVSYGMDIENSADGVVYSEMAYGNAYDKRSNDYNNSQILPGVSESQDIVSRKTNPDPSKIPPNSGNSFIEPNTNTSINKFERD